MKRVKYHQRFDGDTFPVSMKSHRIRCCDCKLVHDLKFTLKNGRLFMTASRNNRATANSRRAKQGNALRPSRSRKET